MKQSLITFGDLYALLKYGQLKCSNNINLVLVSKNGYKVNKRKLLKKFEEMELR